MPKPTCCGPYPFCCIWRTAIAPRFLLVVDPAPMIFWNFTFTFHIPNLALLYTFHFRCATVIPISAGWMKGIVSLWDFKGWNQYRVIRPNCGILKRCICGNGWFKWYSQKQSFSYSMTFTILSGKYLITPHLRLSAIVELYEVIPHPVSFSHWRSFLKNRNYHYFLIVAF